MFTPEIVRIEPGQTVEWTMDGRSPHTVQADDGSWDSGNLEPGAEFDHTPSEKRACIPFFCRYHGKPGAGMAGTVVVGDAPLPGGGVPGPDPVPPGPAGTVRVPGDAPTIQQAVDQAEPGGLVLIAAGVYREAVVVTTPYLTIRGMDRNDTILEGDFELANGIHVIEADGVAVENLTARHFLLNGFYWSGVLGYRGSYLTASHERRLRDLRVRIALGTVRSFLRERLSRCRLLHRRVQPVRRRRSPTCSQNTTPSGTRGPTRAGTSRS